MTLFKGAGVALVTPFQDGKVDYDAMGDLIDWQIAEGIDAIISCGTTGEASTLSTKEHIETVAYTVKRVNGRVPVIAGSGSNDTSHAQETSLAMQEAGADGLLVVTPYYNKCTQKGLITHYTAIADQIKIPMIIYSVAGRTGVNISPFAVSELYQHENIVGIKEASGDISQVVEISQYITEDFALYSGNDDMIVPLMAMGGAGVISTVANIAPADTHQLTQSYLDGRHEEAARRQIQMKPLIDAVFAEVNPIPVKAALALMGKIQSGYRLPLSEPAEATLMLLKKEMARYGLLQEVPS